MRLAYGIFLRSHAFDDHIEAIYISFGSETPVDVIITSWLLSGTISHL